MIKLDKGFYYSFAGAFLWAVSIVLLRFILVSGENVYSVMFWMTLIGFPFWLLVFLKNKNEIRGLQRRDYLILISIVLVSSIAQTIVDLFAVKYSFAINYSFLIRAVVLFTFIFAYFFLGEKLNKGKAVIALAIIAGAYLLTTSGQAITLGIGDLLTLLDAVLISLGNSILGKMATNRMKPMFVVSATAIGAFLPEAGIALYLGRTIAAQNLSLIVALSFLYLALSAIRFTSYKYASASFVAVMMSLTPVFVSLMAIPLLGESISIIQAIGGLLIVGAGIFAVKSKI